jgi:hypothetical protein
VENHGLDSMIAKHNCAKVIMPLVRQEFIEKCSIHQRLFNGLLTGE